MPRERGQKAVATNRKARHDFFIEDVYEAGLVLTGTEVKTLREGRASLVDGYASIEGNQAYLENVHIPEFFQGSWTNHLTRRRRKLLLNRLEIDRISAKVKQSGYTLVPLSIYFKDGYAKVEIALAKGKKDYDKRQTLKEAQDKRDVAKELARRNEKPGDRV